MAPALVITTTVPAMVYAAILFSDAHVVTRSHIELDDCIGDAATTGVESDMLEDAHARNQNPAIGRKEDG